MNTPDPALETIRIHYGMNWDIFLGFRLLFLLPRERLSCLNFPTSDRQSLDFSMKEEEATSQWYLLLAKTQGHDFLVTYTWHDGLKDGNRDGMTEDGWR